MSELEKRGYVQRYRVTFKPISQVCSFLLFI